MVHMYRFDFEGKFSQNENNSTVKFVNDYEQLISLNNKCYMMTSLDFVTENAVRVTLLQKDKLEPC